MTNPISNEFNHIYMKAGTELKNYQPGNDFLNTAIDCVVNQDFVFKLSTFSEDMSKTLFVFERKSDAFEAAVIYENDCPTKSIVAIKDPTVDAPTTYTMEAFILKTVSEKVKGFIQAEERKNAEAAKAGNGTIKRIIQTNL